MCENCGCSDGAKATIRMPGEKGHSHTHDHDHSNDHSHDHKRLDVEQDILSANSLLAERNRGYFEARKILSINLMSSPGSGKTTLLEKTIIDLKSEIEFYVIEGDQQTLNDAERIKASGATAIQVNTGNGCHLDADMVNQAVKIIDPPEKSVLMIENVGNLVCPSLFDLGESKRVVIISVTEGEDKPAKYPTMFESADLCIINKTDLLPYVSFDVQKAKEYGLMANHHLKFIELSATTGDGMNEWFSWLKETMTES
jgi:hydrogenase nickel incorporation protein HypB